MYKVIEDFEDLKSIYMFAFELFRDRDISHKMLKYEAAVSIWGQLILPSTYKYKVEIGRASCRERVTSPV